MKEATRFEQIPPDDDHMPIADWLATVECGGFIDYDGWGNLATADSVSDVVIRPSEAHLPLPAWATHIVWYNR